jgi:3-methylcrotonyl-CoA carboxylase alpha subunit
MFKKILIANRGEIACRVIATARRMGIKTVAVYSDADAKARHVRLADETVHIGGSASRDSYLKGDVIIEAAKRTGAEAIHPGYGFLSENESFAKTCAKADIVFIGPTPGAINAMGLKDKAKEIMAKAGVLVVPGYMGDNQDPKFLQKQADGIGYPVLIKAVAGGGGKGMRLVEKSADFVEALASCQREAQNSFGNAHVLIEKYIQKPRHVEVQVFGDSKGNAVYLWERDCSLQRRHQKVVEEAPAPGLPDKTRKALGDASVKAVKALGYTNAGTIEFIMDSQTFDFYFMEMNTRLQVEHPVTEMITGLDLVEWQLRVAAGEALPLAQKDIQLHGHAFEVRLYAEDPANGFLPQIGIIDEFTLPSSPRRRGSGDAFPLFDLGPPDPRLRGDNDAACVRIDTGVEAGDAVTIFYDPMIAKIIVHGVDRESAIKTMQKALKETGVSGLVNNQEFLANIFHQKDFIAGKVDTGFIARHESDLLPESYGRAEIEDLAIAAICFLSSPVSSHDIWSVSDNWRMNAALARSLTEPRAIGEISGNMLRRSIRYRLQWPENNGSMS